MTAQEIDVLFIDDQWCRPDERSTILAAFGELQHRDPPYRFHFETAEESPGHFGPEPVLRHLGSLRHPGAVVLDIMFGADGNQLGLSLLAAIRGKHPTLPVLMMTSLAGNLDVVERAMELGANEYLVKKPRLSELENALDIYTHTWSGAADHAIWGNSAAIRRVRALIARVAAGSSVSVLVTGESGTGKELVARAMHRQG